MTDAESWGELWDRTKKTAKVKSRNIRNSDDFADLHWTADEILEQDISETLTEAAREIEEPPQPGRRYRIGAALEDYSESVNRGWKVPRLVIGALGGLAIGTSIALNSNPDSLSSLGPQIGGTAGGSIGAVSDYFAAKGIEKTGEKVKGSDSDMQQVGREGSHPSLISNRLSERENDVYGFKAFREDGIDEWTELPDGEELYDFLRDMNVEAETDWIVKRKDERPLQVVGLTATYEEPHDHTYDRRNRIAEEIAEDENVPVEEILDVGGDGATPVPRESDYKEGEQTYKFVIVDTNPEHSYDMENDFMDYSDILGIQNESRNYETGQRSSQEPEREVLKEN